MVVLWISSPARSEMPKGEYLAGRNSAAAVILAHGRGLGPDTQVVGPLRKEINRELGFHTLSLQMPVLRTNDYTAYVSVFPDAFNAIQAAIDCLTGEKGVRRIYLMGYSMGARMTTAFIAERPTPVIVGYIGVGLLKGGDRPLDANKNLLRFNIPVIDIFADKSALDLASAEERKRLVSDKFRQVGIAGADHSFRGYDNQVIQAVVEWLREQEGKEPR